VMSAITQYSLGFAWFAGRVARERGTESPVASFPSWRAPRFFALVTILALGLRLFSGEVGIMVADNLLAAVSVVYAITGLALFEYYLRRFRIKPVLKVVFYLLLVPTGLVGYLALALFGLTNSIYDWRSIRASE